jgi:DNA-binding winged helix-turn-helix (wHTH) protein
MSVRVRFGVFDLDVAGMELRKNGVRIRLQEQPFRILATLVGRPGEVVTREELKDQIWASDTFVDFDQSLNKAVNRLREVLNDHPSHPRYIETVTRRGYRFVAHVTDITPILDPLLAPAAAVAETKKARRNHRGIRIGAIAGTVAITLAVLVATLFFHAPRKAASTTPILLIPDSFHPTLSRDGKLLAYVSTVGGDVPHIWVRQTGGGKAIKVTAGTARDFAPDLSPDGTQILFSSEQAMTST